MCGSISIICKCEFVCYQIKFVMTSDDSVMSDGEPEKKVTLERTVSLIGGVALIAGTMIGVYSSSHLFYPVL